MRYRLPQYIFPHSHLLPDLSSRKISRSELSNEIQSRFMKKEKKKCIQPVCSPRLPPAVTALPPRLPLLLRTPYLQLLQFRSLSKSNKTAKTLRSLQLALTVDVPLLSSIPVASTSSASLPSRDRVGKRPRDLRAAERRFSLRGTSEGRSKKLRRKQRKRKVKGEDEIISPALNLPLPLFEREARENETHLWGLSEVSTSSVHVCSSGNQVEELALASGGRAKEGRD